LSAATSIEWTDTTWNPDVRMSVTRVVEPLRWRKPRRVFVNSMSDLFHEDVTSEFIDCVFAVMSLSPQQTYQVLTKRPERMERYMSQKVIGQEDGFSYGDRIALVACDVLDAIPERLANAVARRTGLRRPTWPLPNVWLGVSVENQETADQRIPILLDTPAAVRFLSCEPLLAPIDLRIAAFNGIDWVIVGGESGPGARPCEVAWIRSIVEQCKAAGVPAFVKQLGAHSTDAGTRTRHADSKGGDPAEWPVDLCVRDFPAPAGGGA